MCHGSSYCGNGAIDSGETCDDSNLLLGDGCSGTCSEEPGYYCYMAPGPCSTTCGDGIFVALHEQCDDGNPTNSDGCSSCVIDHGFGCSGYPMSLCSSTCGDSLVASNEVCDDGINDGLGCEAGCTSITVGYYCTGEPSSCFNYCGNGANNTMTTPAYTEQCDDGNIGSGDGCSASCGIESGY